MALLTKADLLYRIRNIIQDSVGTRWPDAELELYVLDGMVKIAALSPESGPTGFVTHALSVGIEQEISTNGVGRAVSRVLDVINNRTGSTQGKPIRKVAKDQLDAQRPNWATETASTTVLNWMPHDEAPTSFLVYPPAASGASVRAKVAIVPNSADSIEVIDSARDAVVFYAVSRAWMKDETYSKTSAEYMALFNEEMKALLGGNTLSSTRTHERQKPR